MARETRNAVLLNEVRTLFGCGVVRDSSDGELLGRFLTQTTWRPRRPSRFSLSVTDRWYSTFAGKCSTIPTTPRMPFRRHF